MASIIHGCKSIKVLIYYPWLQEHQHWPPPSPLLGSVVQMNLNRAPTNSSILCTHVAITWPLFADRWQLTIICRQMVIIFFLCWQIVIMEKQTLTEERQTTLHSWEKVQWKKGLCVERSYRGPLLESLPSEYSSNATLSWARRLKSVKCSEVEEQERRGKQIDSAAVSIFVVILVDWQIQYLSIQPI